MFQCSTFVLFPFCWNLRSCSLGSVLWATPWTRLIGFSIGHSISSVLTRTQTAQRHWTTRKHRAERTAFTPALAGLGGVDGREGTGIASLGAQGVLLCSSRATGSLPQGRQAGSSKTAATVLSTWPPSAPLTPRPTWASAGVSLPQALTTSLMRVGRRTQHFLSHSRPYSPRSVRRRCVCGRRGRRWH
jgi:hypothetical protein